MKLSADAFKRLSESFDRDFTEPFRPMEVLSTRYDVLYGHGVLMSPRDRFFWSLNMAGAQE